MGGKVLNVEQVVRSNGQYFLEDIMVKMQDQNSTVAIMHSLISLNLCICQDKYNLTGVAQQFLYQVEPEAGYYCM